MPFFCMVMAFWTLLFSAVSAHEWYDPWCCNGGDCSPVHEQTARVSRHGYAVTLCPGDHPLVVDSCISKTFTFQEARPSADGRFHACIYPAGQIRCFYAPQGGV